MKRTLTLATVSLVGLAVVLAFSLTSLTSDNGGSGQSAPELSQGAVVKDSPLPTDQSYPSKLLESDITGLPEQLPASLQGTRAPEGWRKTDANGSLVPTPQLRQLFEYYLAALGEETLEVLVARIKEALSTLEEPARSEALAILGAYLDYKLELGELESASGGSATMDPEAMAQQQAKIQSLRRQWLDAQTVDAFFGLEEAVDRYQLARIRIAADESLSDEARAARLREAEQALPAPLREARQETRKFSEYQQMREQLDGDPEALQAWRQETFGAEAADRLAQVEAEQQAWDERWQAYRRERARLDSLGLAGPELDDAIQRLREKHFEGPEIYRAEALDSLQ